MDSKQQIAIVLGGTSPHAELCELLKKRGYHTILIDYLEKPPASLVADEHVRESTLDPDKVFEIAVGRKADLVIATCIDQANVTACDVLGRLGKYAPYSYETALKVSNKNTMKSIMIDNGIPTSRFVCITDASSKEWKRLSFPLIVKPCDSNGSKGVRRCDTPEEVIKHLPAALEISRKGEAIVEEFKCGREIAFDGYVLDGRLQTIITRERRKIGHTSDDIQQIYGSFWPADLTSTVESKLAVIGEKIARAFKLNNTPLMLQAIVDGEDVYVIEFAPRIGGGENYNIIQMATRFNAINAAIDSFLGISPVLNVQKPSDCILDNYLYAKPSVFGRIEGLEHLYKQGAISSFHVYKSTGSLIGKGISSNNRVAAFTVRSATQDEGLEKINSAISEIEIYDIDDSPVMIREIY